MVIFRDLHFSTLFVRLWWFVLAKGPAQFYLRLVCLTMASTTFLSSTFWALFLKVRPNIARFIALSAIRILFIHILLQVGPTDRNILFPFNADSDVKLLECNLAFPLAA